METHTGYLIPAAAQSRYDDDIYFMLFTGGDFWWNLVSVDGICIF